MATNKVVDTQNGIPAIRNWVKKQISDSSTNVTGSPTDSADALTLNGLSNKINEKIESLDSSAEAATDGVITSITITDGKISSHKETNLNSSVTAGENSVLSSVTIKGGKITDHKEINLNSSVKASKNHVLSGLTIVGGKIVGHDEYDVSNLYRFMGSVDTEDDLPTTGQTAGDVYNIVARSSYGMPGMNVAWVEDATEATGGHWDKLGSGLQIDYATADEITNILNAKS